MKAWLSKMNRLYIFTPSRWPHRELISRTTALTFITLFIALRSYNFHSFPATLEGAQTFYGTFSTADGIPLYTSNQIILLWSIKLTVWIIETLIYIGYIISYTSRVRAVEIAQGFMEVAFPIIVAGTPVLISFVPYGLPRWLPYTAPEHLAFYIGIMALIICGGMLNLIGLLTLRRAFAIMSEARTLITSGIFSHIRHPLYAGHFIMFFGSLLLRLHWISIMLYLLFLVGQVARAKIEERKMMGAFPQYAEYRSRTGMFFPKLTSLGS